MPGQDGTANLPTAQLNGSRGQNGAEFSSRLSRRTSPPSNGRSRWGNSTSGASVNRNLDNQLRTRRKVAKMLIAVVIMFAINFFPVHFLPIVQVGL